MIKGAITAKHILLHPVMMIATLGLFGYIRLIAKCMSSTNYCFIDFISLK